MITIPPEFQDLLQPETRAIAYLATIMPDGSPQLTAVWFSWDGAFIQINSARGRVKDRNMRNRPAVAILVADPKSVLRYIQIRGKVVEITEEGALEHIDRLSLVYNGVPWKKVPGQVRVLYKIRPEHVSLRA
ncbi:MAG TPA: PPOX class F420-dependent oxidoreductase [Anaerolineaceae bacterium]|nr:PPOX class F420-dependent oxidoreductase [Anaerolineaceae bacterium]